MKNLKLPNGFGSISYYGDHRRRPYVVKKYIDGKQKPIGYFATYEDALAYLVAYNKNPSLFNPSEITFTEIFKLWSAEHFPKIAKTTAANYTAAYKHCEALYGKKFISLKISDLQVANLLLILALPHTHILHYSYICAVAILLFPTFVSVTYLKAAWLQALSTIRHLM